MHTATAMNAINVPALATAAMFCSGTNAAINATITLVTNVISTGVPKRGWTLLSRSGSNPSRAITKKMRDWPYMNAMITVGSAITAAEAINVAATRWFRLRNTIASGSALLARAW